MNLLKAKVTQLKLKKIDDYEIIVDNDNPSIKNISFKIIDSNNNIEHKKISTY